MLIAVACESDFPETMLVYIKYWPFPSYWAMKASRGTQSLSFSTQACLK